MSTPTRRTFDEPDGSMGAIEKITVDTVTIGGQTLARATAQPGWRWSVHSRPVVQTDSCQVDHLLFVVSGRLATKSADGSQIDYSAGDLGHVPPGHDGWTIGDEPAVWIEVPH